MTATGAVFAIADDLTGALEAGAVFAARGMRSVVTLSGVQGLDHAVIVVDTETRHSQPALAERIVGELPQREALIYKKTDSTLRGNIGPELRALRRTYGGRIAYVPAYPGMSRVVRNGHLYVDGVPVHETPFARDPLNPVTRSDVRSLLDPECDCVVFEGEVVADVERAADVILADPDYRIVAGPAAIAQALAGRMGIAVTPQWPNVRRCLIVNGSRHPKSHEQVQSARALWRGDEWSVFPLPQQETAAPRAFADNVGREVCARLAEEPFDGILVFGGDTAHGILRAMGTPLLHPFGEVVPGVPVSRIAGRPEILITKAGGFGPTDVVALIRRELDDSR